MLITFIKRKTEKKNKVGEICPLYQAVTLTLKKAKSIGRFTTFVNSLVSPYNKWILYICIKYLTQVFQKMCLKQMQIIWNNPLARSKRFLLRVHKSSKNLKKKLTMIYLNVSRNAAKSCLSIRLARSLLKAITPNRLRMTGLGGSLYLIEIHQHENVWLLLSLFYRLINDWVELVRMNGKQQFFEDLPGDLKLHTLI